MVEKRCESYISVRREKISTYLDGIYEGDLTGALGPAGFPFSLSGTIKVPISHATLLKLTSLLYTHKPPHLTPDCHFNSLTAAQKSTELHSLTELSFLGQYWCWPAIQAHALRSVRACVEGNWLDVRVCLRVVKFAVELEQWEVVEGAVRWLAPKYPKLRSGAIGEDVGERVMEMLRKDYVRLL